MQISERDRKTIEKTKQTQAEIETVSRLKKEGLSAEEIADSMELPKSRIMTLIRRYGIN